MTRKSTKLPDDPIAAVADLQARIADLERERDTERTFAVLERERADAAEHAGEYRFDFLKAEEEATRAEAKARAIEDGVLPRLRRQLEVADREAAGVKADRALERLAHGRREAARELGAQVSTLFADLAAKVEELASFDAEWTRERSGIERGYRKAGRKLSALSGVPSNGTTAAGIHEQVFREAQRFVRIVNDADVVSVWTPRTEEVA